jgi:hypothetical protein
MGLIERRMGTKSSPRTATKLEGNRPIILLSLCSLPIHHEPSPALRHSIRSPSINPRSRSVSPPHEYTARHQQGNFVGSRGDAIANALQNVCHLSLQAGVWHIAWCDSSIGLFFDRVRVRRNRDRTIKLDVWTTLNSTQAALENANTRECVTVPRLDKNGPVQLYCVANSLRNQLGEVVAKPDGARK